MPNINELLQKIAVLENRIQELEKQLAQVTDPEEQKFMDALYIKAKEIVAKYNNSSVIFIQKKLIIDYPRASKIISRLKAEGFIQS